MTIPRLPGFDSSLDLLADGYLFGTRRFDQLQSDVFRTRVMFKPAIFLRGPEAAALFYGGGNTTRAAALPRSIVHSLQDAGSVQSLDGAEHANRKDMFMRMLQGAPADELALIFREEWLRALLDWEQRPSIVLHDELLLLLTRTAVRWAGAPEEDLELLSGELGAMVERAGAFGPQNWLARARRRRTEHWARSVIDRARAGTLPLREGSALWQLMRHEQLSGRPLDSQVAGIELINLLRPIVAVARFIVFSALALHNHPQWDAAFLAGDRSDLRHFAHEVRRFYPFFPVIGGRALRPLETADYRITTGEWMFLDLYATNHDERSWSDANRFRPQRFRDWDGDPNTLVPQGAGFAGDGHRCPGEPATVGLIEEAALLLSRSMRYTVPPQDLRVSLRRMPALPESRFVLSDVVRT